MMDEDRKKLPQWARDRLDADELMGDLETSASPVLVVGATLAILLRSDCSC